VGTSTREALKPIRISGLGYDAGGGIEYSSRTMSGEAIQSAVLAKFGMTVLSRDTVIARVDNAAECINDRSSRCDAARNLAALQRKNFCRRAQRKSIRSELVQVSQTPRGTFE